MVFTKLCMLLVFSSFAFFAKAQNKVTSVGVSAQSGAVTYGTSAVATYTVTLTTDGNTPDGTSDLSLNWATMPSGATFAFSPASTVTLLSGSTSQTATLTITSATTTHAGNYDFTVSSTNDVQTSATATFVVSQAPLTITALNQSKTYGTALALGNSLFTSTGLASGETIGNVTLTSTGSAAGAAVAGSPYSIIPSGATGGTFDPTNYIITYDPSGTLTVTQVTLTITANNGTKAYGATYTTGAGSTLFTSTGLQNGETIGSITIASTGAPATASVAGSPYPIVPSAATGGTFNASNYTIIYANGTLTVTKVTLTITVTPVSKSYGTAYTTGAGYTLFTSSGLQNGETIGSITIASGGAAATAAVGSYPIISSSATGGTFNASNYTLSYPSATLTVTKVTLTITANNGTKTYGATYATGAGSTLFTSTGLQNGQTIGSITTASTGAVNTAAIGTYPIVPSSATGGTFNASNYTIVYANGTLTVTQVTLTITANNGTKAYGATYTTGAGSTLFTSTGLQNGETIGSITIASTGAPAAASVAGSPYSIVPSAATGGTFTAANYNIVYSNGTLTITQPTLTITANNGTKVFGAIYTTGAGSTLFTSTGLQNGETIGSITIASTGAPAAASVAGSPYSIVPSAATGGTFNAANYNIVYVNGTLTVTKPTLTITATNGTKVYGTVYTTGAGSTLFTSTGLQNGETIGSVTIASTGAVATAAVAGSPYLIVPSAATGGTFTAANYNIVYVNGSLTVTKPTVTITANNGTKVYGTVYTTGAGSTLFTSTGLQNGETIGSITISSTGAPANASIAGSPYSIVPSAATGGTFAAANYNIVYANGTLTITQATLTITANNGSKVYGNVFTTGTGSTLFTSTGLQNSETIGSITIASTGAPAAAAVGTYPIVPSAATGGTFTASNYSITYNSGTLTVTQAALTITASNGTKAYGTIYITGAGSTLFTPTGLKNGETVGSITTASTGAPAAAAAGTYPIVPSAPTGGTFNAANYSITFTNGTLTVTKPTLTITANNGTKVYGTVFPTGAGSIAFTSTGLQNGETIGSITITSTGAAAAATVGTYSIIPSAATGGTFTASNYTIVYTNGTLTVTQATPSIALVSNNNPSCFGTSITFTATITSVLSNATGQIQFLDGATSLGTATIASATASLTTSALTAGSHSITAKYLGDGNYSIVTSAILNQVVNPAPATTTVSGAGAFCATTTITASNGGDGTMYFEGTTSGGTSTATPSNSQPITTSGTYYFRAQSALGCWGVEGSALVTINPLPSISLSASPLLICQGATSSLTATSSGGTVARSASNNNPVTISASGTPTITSSITIPAGASINASDITLSINLTHTWAGDLTATLISPSCGSAVIFNRPGGTANGTNLNAGPFIFTSASATTFVASTAQRNGGLFNATFAGISFPCANTSGTWTLQITDNASGDGGTLNGWSLTLGSPTSNYTTVFSGPASIGSTTYSGASNSIATAIVTPPAGSNVYTAVTTDGAGCSSPASSPVTIVVNPTLTAGTVGTSQTICYNTIPTAFTSLTLPTGGNAVYSYQWQSSPNNTTWTNIGGATSTTYAPGALTATTYYRRNETSGVCGTVSSNVITITVNPNLVAGTVGTSQTICYNTIPNAFTSTTLPTGGTGTYSYQWQSSPDNSTWTNISGAAATTYAPGALTATTYYRRNESSGTCGTVTSNVITITVYNNLTAGTVGTSQAICFNTTPAAFTSITLPAGGNGSYAYQWQSSPDNTTWTNISGATATTYAPGVLTVMTYYRRNETSGTCGTVTSNVITISINPLPVVNITGPNPICAGFTTTLSPATGGTWVSNNPSIATVNASTGIVTGVATITGTATFTFTITATGCVNTTSALTVNALPVVAAITDGATNICVNSITQFTDATSGGTWSITNGTGTATIDATGTVTGVSAGTVTVVYTYSNGTCTNKATAPLTIDLQPAISPVTGGATTVCVSGQTPAFTDATSGGTWSIINGSGSATITSGGVVTGVSAGTVTVLYTTNNLSCTNEAGVSLMVIAAPPVAPIAAGVARVCISSPTPAFTDATSGGTWGITNGTGSATINTSGIVTPVTAGTVTVTYTISNGTCNNIATISLIIDPIPTVAAIGGGGSSVCLNGTTPAFTDATTGGTWSVTNGTGTASITTGGVVTGLTTGTVTVVYTVNNATCSNTATASLTVNALPVAGAITGASAVCIGSTITLNPNATGSGTLTYTWTSSNTSFATVTNAGVVTGVGAGSPGITYVVSDGNGCSATSPLKTIIVNPRPSASITSVNVAICKGNNTNITGTVVATGAWTLTLSNSSTATGTGNGSFSISVNPITNTTYTISSLTDASCTSIAGDITGSTVVTVNNPPNLSTVGDVSVCNTIGASFFVNAGPGTFTYQWYKVPGTIVNNTANITGATTNILHFNQAGVSDIGDYYVIVTGLAPCGSAQSNNAHLDVSGTITIGTQPASQTVCTGTNVTFTVAASTTSGNTLTYQWTKNGSNIAGATLSAYTITGATTTDAGNYAVSITDISTCPNAFSTTAVLTVNPIPTGSISGDVTVCQGGTSPNITFTNPQALPVTITYNINGTGTATINVAANSTATVAAPTGTSGVFAYNLVSVAYQAAPGCTNSITGTATVTVNPTPTATISGTITVCQGSTAPNITFTNPNPLAVTITYNINGSGTTTVNVAASSTATVAALTGAGGIFNYNLVSVAYQSAPGCSTPVSGVATVTVNPTPTATISGTTTVCQSSAAPNITFTNPQALAVTITYNINGSGTTTINVGANTTGTIAAPTGVAGTFIYNLTNVAYQSAPGCSTPLTGSATITVKATPTISATNTSQNGCSPKTINAISITNPNTITGATYTWTRDNGTLTTGNVTGIAASGSGNFPGPGSISGTLTNTTASPVTVTFTITPFNGTCSGTPVTATVLVNPAPVMTSVNALTICNNTVVGLPFTSTVSSTYSWKATTTNANVTGASTGLQSSGTLSDQLNNTTAAYPYNNGTSTPGLTPRQPVTYTVTPTSTPTGCPGTPQDVVVTVNPVYNATFVTPSDINTENICDGVTLDPTQNDIDLLSGDYRGSTLLWQYSTTTSTGPWTAMPGPFPNNEKSDTFPDPPSIFSPAGTYYFRLLIDACSTDILTLTKTSTLTIAAGGPNTVCESGTPGQIPLSGSNVNGTTSSGATVGGTWSITSLSPSNGSNQGTLSNTGFITSASGNIPNVKYTPPANYAGTVTLTLTSVDPDGTGPCVPLTATRTITITQAPIISNPSTMSICSGSNTNITLASAIPSTYTMTLGAVTGGITGASAIAGNITAINQVLTNPSTTTTGTVTYNITPTPNPPYSGCAAVTSSIVVTVTPPPSMVLSKSPTTNVCQGSSATLTATNSGGTLNGTLSGANYVAQQIQSTGPSTISSSITLPAGTITAASSITLTMNINHTYQRDLTATLISPSCGTGAIFSTPGNIFTGSDDLAGNYTFTSTSATNFPDNNDPTTPQTYKATFAGITFPCVSAAGNWILQINDNNNFDGGFLNNWTLTINTNGVYTSVFSGNPTIGSVTYSGATNTAANATVTPPAGTNNYTVTTTDANGCSATSAPIAVVVNPTLTLTGATTSAVCAGSPATINLSGLQPSITTNVTYKIASGTPVTVSVTSTAAGTGTFNTANLTSVNNGQILQITGIAYTSTPLCSQTFTQNVSLIVNPTPTLSGATQAAAVCPNSSAQINLAGLVSNSTSTITYTIAGGLTQTVTGVVATGTTANFTTIPLTYANNGQVLQITGITITSATPGCTQTFTQNLTLAVNPTPALTSTLTPPALCSGNTFSYTPSSISGSSFTWTRAAVVGISQPASSGGGSVSEMLTNTTSSPVNVTYVYVVTANGCSNAPGQNVVVSVSPSPTMSSVSLSQTGSACEGTGGTFVLIGLTPNYTATLYYTINNGPLLSVIVTSDATGKATFTSANLALSNNGQIFKITGVSGTSCIKSVTIISLISVNPSPTLTGASQGGAVCEGAPATVNLTGMVASSTNNTINYTINGVAEPAITGVNADASGNASFNTIVLTAANNGQSLVITSIANATSACSKTFNVSFTLAVNASNVWLGVNNNPNNWFDPSNWCGGIPTITSNIIIPVVGTNYYPTINTGNGFVNNITIQSGGPSVTVSGGTLTIHNNITNNGVFDVTNGTVELNGTSVQTIGSGTFSTNTLRGLVISNAAGVTLTGALNITDSLTYGATNGILNSNGNLTLKSTITQTAFVGDMTNHVINGNVTVERYIATGSGSAPNHGKSWQLLAVPTTGQTIKAAWQEGATTTNVASPGAGSAGNLVSGYGTMLTSDIAGSNSQPTPGFDAVTTPGPSIKYYNAATGLYAGPTSTALPVYDQRGYFVFVRGDRSVNAPTTSANPTILRTKGLLFTPSNLPPVTNVTAGKFESVGNPYAAPVDVRKITLGGGTQQFFQVWDPRLGGAYNYGAFQTLSLQGSNYFATPGGGSYGSGPVDYIQSGQAFFVQAFGSNGTVTFTEAAKAGSSFSGTIFARQGNGNTRSSSAQTAQSILRTTLHTVNSDGSTGEVVDGVLNRFGDSYSNQVDGLDARKSANTGENLSIKTGGMLLSIESKHAIIENDTIFLNLTRERVQPYQFSFDAQNLNTMATGFVEDTYLKTRTPLNLSGNTLLNFTIANVAGSYAPDRFRIVFSPLKVLPVTFTSIKAYKQNKDINVEWKVENERNIKQYELEKSVNGKDFSKLATILPTANNGSSAVYALADTKAVTGYNYYRVRSTDINGSISYSTVVDVMISVIRQDININPNPITDGQIHLQFLNEPAGRYGIRLLNKLGQVIMQKQIAREDGTSTEIIKWDFNLSHGMYQLEVTKPDGSLKDINVLY